MGHISYPRNSGGDWNKEEKKLIREAAKRKHGEKHLAPAKNKTKTSLEDARTIVKKIVGYPGKHPGTTIYYDPVKNISVLVGSSGSIIGIYSGRINGKLDVSRLRREQQERINKRREEYDRTKIEDKRVKPTSFSKPSIFYPNDKQLPISRKTTAGIINLELAWVPSDKEKQKELEISGRLYDGYNDPYPYKKGTKVDFIKLKKPKIFIRLHNENNPNRRWIMTRETYEKHSLQELKEMFSLPYDAFIDRVSEVTLPEEVNIRRGIASPNEKIGLPGGGIQYEIVGIRDKKFIGNNIPEGYFDFMGKIE